MNFDSANNYVGLRRQNYDRLDKDVDAVLWECAGVVDVDGAVDDDVNDVRIDPATDAKAAVTAVSNVAVSRRRV